MLLSDKYRFCFVHIPKTGGTSIKKALLPFANPGQLFFDGEKVTDGDGFRPHRIMTKGSYLRYKDYFKFTIVRNPWARHASIWKFLTGRKDPHIGDVDFDTYIYMVYSKQLIYSRNQVDFIKHSETGDSWLVDYIGRYESLLLSFDYICDRLLIDPGPLPHYKNQGNYDYKDMYTSKTKDMIATHCKDDIDEFNYEYDDS